MKITVKRRHILDALRYNNLIAGNWFSNFESELVWDYELGDEKTKPFNPNCSACLVGSSVRRAFPQCTLTEKAMERMDKLLQNTMLRQAHKHCLSVTEESDADELVKKGLYLAALSAKFEGVVRNKAHRANKEADEVHLSKREQRRISDWVKKNIPVSFEATLTKNKE